MFRVATYQTACREIGEGSSTDFSTPDCDYPTCHLKLKNVNCDIYVKNIHGVRENEYRGTIVRCDPPFIASNYGFEPGSEIQFSRDNVYNQHNLPKNS